MARALHKCGCVPLLGTLVLGLCWTAVGVGQETDASQLYKLEVHVDLVQVPTLVLTSLHKSYPGLSPQSFSVTFDGKPVSPPKYVRLEGNDPVAFAVLLDVSQKEQLEIARRFSDGTEPVPSEVFTSIDHASVLADDCNLARSIQDVPATIAVLRTGVRDALASPTLHGGAGEKPRCGAKRQIWNVMATTILQLQKLPGSRVLLVVSDGKDHGSTTSSEAVRRLAIRSGVTIFALKPEPPSTTFSPVDDGKPQFEIGKGDDLATFCAGTGGLTFYDKSETIGSTIARVMKLLRNRYILDFPRPKNTTDGEHTIDVRVPDASAIIRVSGTIFPSRERHSIDDPRTLPLDPSHVASATIENPKPSIPADTLPFRPTVPIIGTVATQPAQQQPVPTQQQPIPAQQQPIPTLHAVSRLVYVDIVAHDKHGKVSTGLTQDDFQVSERPPKSQNQRQKISFFEEIDFTRGNPLPAANPRQISDSHVDRSEENPPPTILLIDEMNTNLTGQRAVIQKLAAMIDAIPPRSSTALFAMLSGRVAVLQNFTLDHALLKQAAERAFPSRGISFSSLAGQNLNDDPNSRYTHTDFATFAAKSTSAAFQQIAAQMATVPGRKNLIWVSDSFPSSVGVNGIGLDGGPRNDQESFESSAIQPAIAALSAARVAVYSVAVSSLEPPHLGVEKTYQPPPRASAGVGNTAPAPRPAEDIAVSDLEHGIVSDELMRNTRLSTMQVISEETGGIVCTNVYDLPGCVAKAMNDGSHYYEIAYYPTSHAPGIHDIIVKTKRSGVTFTYRQNYDSESSKPQP